MRRYRHSTIILALLAFNLSSQVIAQPVSIDRGVRAEGLWCFPLVSDSLSWLYLPDRGVLALDENKKPQFSFIRYVDIKDNADPDEAGTINDAAGGGVLHFLVTYDTDERKVARAADKLREIFSNGKIKIKGPIIFKEGRYALVSSILNQQTGDSEKKIMSVGSAPVLQGSKIALSFELDPLRSKLLLESMKMPTPDVSIVFDMTFSGLMDAYKATIRVNWSDMQKVDMFRHSGKFYYFGADLELAFQEMRKNGAVTIHSEGEDDKMQQIVDAAFAKVMDMMFQPVEPESLPGPEKDQMSEAMPTGTNAAGSYFPIAGYTGYKKKNIKTSGSNVLSFSSRASVDRHYNLTFNLGDFYKKYGEDTSYIRTVSIEDPSFQQRDIAVGVDGTLMPEFEKMINSVTVTLKKDHKDGTTTLRNVNLTKSLIDKGRSISMSYGSFGDIDRLAWLSYEYNAHFNFLGGRTWETGWRKQDAGVINLLTPYERKVIRLEGNADTLKAKNVRATTVQVEYLFLDGIKKFETTVKPDDDLSKMQFEIVLPEGKTIYKYTLKWRLNNGIEKVAKGETDSGILFIDLVPGN